MASVDVILRAGDGFMKIDDKSGSIEVSGDYIRSGDERHIYLDLVHELVHIDQLRRGLELWDRRYAYVDRPTEVEAYRVAVEEARLIGLTEVEIAQYLEVPWAGKEDHARLLVTLGVRAPSAQK